MNFIINKNYRSVKKLEINKLELNNMLKIIIKSNYKQEVCIVVSDSREKIFNVLTLKYLQLCKLYIPNFKSLKRIEISRFI